MKTNKLIVVTEEFSQIIPLGQEWDFPKEKFINLIQQTDRFKNEKVLDVADANTHHICQYCGEVAEGTYEEVLCQDCRDTFGHAFYYEL
jgi:hypothetical protein